MPPIAGPVRNSASMDIGSWPRFSGVNRPQLQQIKLALDVHAASIVAVRVIDGSRPQPPQSFKAADFLAWAKEQVALATEPVG